jgi:ribonuclease BN (tRNA processing enzyme)
MAKRIELRFFGTRGYVKARSRRHRHHSAFTVEISGFRLLCDFGETNAGRLAELAPDAIFISHAHPDHAFGLAEGTDKPVYAAEETIRILRHLPVRNWRALVPGRRRTIGPFRLAPFPVVHSIRCPCAAARIEVAGRTLAYSGDIVSFEDEASALTGADLYIGDGSTLVSPLVRRHRSGALIGHTTVRAQLGWLARRNIGRAVFSHFGTGPIELGDR